MRALQLGENGKYNCIYKVDWMDGDTIIYIIRRKHPNEYAFAKAIDNTIWRNPAVKSAFDLPGMNKSDTIYHDRTAALQFKKERTTEYWDNLNRYYYECFQ